MPSLPEDLYRDIVRYLHPYDDRSTLLSSAQCSWVLRDESQRILFCTAFLELWDVVDAADSKVLMRHQAFLEAIMKSSERLGPLVHSYSQYRVSCDVNGAVDSRRDQDAPDAQNWPGQRAHIFNLTAEALHHMPNLKEFRFVPYFGATHPNLLSSIHGYIYPFQLEVFEWLYTGTAREADFISAQRSLRHISVEGWGFKSDGDLQHRISPGLQSTVGALGEFCVIAAGREIVALEYWHNRYQDKLLQLPGVSRPADALARLKYMRVREYESFLHLASQGHAPGVYRIVLMELAIWSREEMSQYHELPASMKVLVLGRTSKSSHIDEQGRHFMARTAFSALPRLIYLYICFRRRGVMIDAWRLSRRSQDDDLDDIHDEIVSFRDASGDDWWREHLDVLDRIRYTKISL